MKLSVWIARWQPATWIALAEAMGLLLVLFIGSGTWIRLALGIPLLAHLAYTAMTSLPLGEVPGPPEGLDERRRNHQLRERVVAFLNEVQRVEEFARRAQSAGLPPEEVEKNLRRADRRIRSTAAEVVEVVGQSGV